MAHKFWDNARNQIAGLTMHHGAEKFLQWPIIHQTMFVGSPAYIQEELNELAYANDWQTVIQWIKETDFLPESLLYRHALRTSGNTIHHAYHLQKYCSTVRLYDLSSYKHIVEIGGGYGNTARIIKTHLNFTGKYTIVDFPELAKIQKHYLQYHGLDDNVEWISPKDVQPTELACDLLIAAFSLNEIPIEERDILLEAFPAFSYLLVYSDTFEDISDNITYFNNFIIKNNNLKWSIIPHEILNRLGHRIHYAIGSF